MRATALRCWTQLFCSSTVVSPHITIHQGIETLAQAGTRLAPSSPTEVSCKEQLQPLPLQSSPIPNHCKLPVKPAITTAQAAGEKLSTCQLLHVGAMPSSCEQTETAPVALPDEGHLHLRPALSPSYLIANQQFADDLHGYPGGDVDAPPQECTPCLELWWPLICTKARSWSWNYLPRLPSCALVMTPPPPPPPETHKKGTSSSSQTTAHCTSLNVSDNWAQEAPKDLHLVIPSLSACLTPKEAHHHNRTGPQTRALQHGGGVSPPHRVIGLPAALMADVLFIASPSTSSQLASPEVALLALQGHSEHSPVI